MDGFIAYLLPGWSASSFFSLWAGGEVRAECRNGTVLLEFDRGECQPFEQPQKF